MKSFMSRIRQLDKIEQWAVASLIAILIGISIGFTFGGVISEFFSSENAVEVAFTRGEPGGELVKVSTTAFSEGSLVSIFTADRGTMVGKDKYKFTNAKLIELYSGTDKIKAVMSADTAEIEIERGEIASASWFGNFQRRQFGLATDE